MAYEIRDYLPRDDELRDDVPADDEFRDRVPGDDELRDDVPGDDGLPEGLLARLKADPVHAPQHLAVAAVDHWGDQAREYARKVRAEHPGATNRELAQMVKSRHALLARMEGAAAGVPGSLAPLAGAAASLLPDITALAWIQSRMVVHIAAVHGYDASDRETAAELLVLLGFYSTTEAARIAVAEAGKRVAARLVNQYIKGATLVLLRQMFRYAGIKFTRTALLRAVPFVSIPISAAVNELSTRSLGNRAMKFYDLDPRGKK